MLLSSIVITPYGYAMLCYLYCLSDSLGHVISWTTLHVDHMEVNVLSLLLGCYFVEIIAQQLNN